MTEENSAKRGPVQTNVEGVVLRNKCRIDSGTVGDKKEDEADEDGHSVAAAAAALASGHFKQLKSYAHSVWPGMGIPQQCHQIRAASSPTGCMAFRFVLFLLLSRPFLPPSFVQIKQCWGQHRAHTYFPIPLWIPRLLFLLPFAFHRLVRRQQ